MPTLMLRFRRVQSQDEKQSYKNLLTRSELQSLKLQDDLTTDDPVPSIDIHENVLGLKVYSFLCCWDVGVDVINQLPGVCS